MAYHVNKAAHLKLKRRREDLKDESICFPIFEWEDSISDCHWTLVQNLVKKEEAKADEGLFADNVAIRSHYFMEERKEVDYFLKIEAEQEQEKLLEHTVTACNAIPMVITAYKIDAEELTAKQNLIFL